MKIFLLILLIALIMIIAKNVAKQYRDRHMFFVSILEFLNEYELNIGFKKEKIVYLVETHIYKGQSKKLFDEYNLYLTQNKDLEFSSLNLINGLERDFLIKMFKSLGTSDYSTEMAQLKFYKSWLEEKTSTTKKDSAKYYPLTVKLSFLFALGVALIFL